MWVTITEKLAQPMYTHSESPERISPSAGRITPVKGTLKNASVNLQNPDSVFMDLPSHILQNLFPNIRRYLPSVPGKVQIRTSQLEVSFPYNTLTYIESLFKLHGHLNFYSLELNLFKVICMTEARHDVNSHNCTGWNVVVLVV